jgi:hypothetical protein
VIWASLFWKSASKVVDALDRTLDTALGAANTRFLRGYLFAKLGLRARSFRFA